MVLSQTHNHLVVLTFYIYPRFFKPYSHQLSHDHALTQVFRGIRELHQQHQTEVPVLLSAPSGTLIVVEEYEITDVEF